MKTRKLTAALLTACLSLSLMTACGSEKKDEEKNSSSNDKQVVQNSQTEQSGSEPVTASKMQKLVIRDSVKNDTMTATFINSVSGATEEIPMTKASQTEDSFIYTCEADTELYNMVHINYGNKEKSKDVAFNSYVSGWYLKDDPNFSYDPLLPYAEGMDLKYDPKFETKTFDDNGKQRTVYIWTPDNYDAKSSEKYATIYTFDGQSVLATGKGRGMDNDKESWNVAESVMGMMAATDKKAIIVAIVTDTDRDDELVPDLGEIYNPPDTPEEYRMKSEKRGNAFADFVCDTIVPYIQENYNVYTDARNTALVGSSLGGLETFYTVLTHPDIFGTGGVLSATFSVYSDDTWNTFVDDKIKADNLPFLYFYAGAYGFDNGDVMQLMYNRLIDKGYPKDKFIYNKYEKGVHLMVFWRDIFSEFLQAVFTQRVEALEFGAKIEYFDKTDMRTQTATEIKIDENDPRLKDKNNFVYYDNSETKWEKVYAYWWSDEGFANNIITGGFYEAKWPGFQMEQIAGTDIYRVVAPDGASNIIFDSGVTDDEVATGINAYQTRDLVYKLGENTGKVYKIDLSKEPKAGRGINKTKFTYGEGSWSDYAG